MDSRLQQGISLFNEGRFFESHEVWEALCLDSEDQQKPFIEGLIQLATACRMITDFGEIKGPVKLIFQALIRFENYPASFLDIKVADLSQSMETWAKDLEATGGQNPRPVPKITQRRFRLF
jgi:predicted metal-dependent hydrolase